MALTKVSRGLLTTSIVDNGNATAITIDSSENVGIGVSTPYSRLQVLDEARVSSASNSAGKLALGDGGTGNDNIGIWRGAANSASDGNWLNLGAWGDSGITFSVGNAVFGSKQERMRIDSSGRVMVALTTHATDANLSSAGANGKFAAAFNNAGTTGAYGVGVASATGEAMYFYHGGTFASLVGRVRTNSTTCFFENLSDQRLKENIEDADDAGSRVDAIQVRKFDWKVDGSHQDYGMIAQELQAVAPEAVSTALNPEDMMGVDYSKLVPMLVKEIQSLRSRVAQLENN